MTIQWEKVPPEQRALMERFFTTYKENFHGENKSAESLFQFLLDEVIQQMKEPYRFTLYHERIPSYTDFGVDFFSPLVDRSSSTIEGLEWADQIETQLADGENAVLFGNHQTEPDPQLIDLMLRPTHKMLAEEMIFVAGHRVTQDPVAVPFSKGRNLISIYSKKYVDNPPEDKSRKVLHNQQAMKKLKALLSEGGKVIYVAPSGGRDRVNEKGVVKLSPFDPESIEMFSFIAAHADKPTHFYPLSLDTYNVLPPPQGIKQELGEARVANFTPIHILLGQEIAMDRLQGTDESDKHVRRKKRAEAIFNLVKSGYQAIHQ